MTQVRMMAPMMPPQMVVPAADQHHDDRQDGGVEGERIGADRAGDEGEQPAGNAADDGAYDEGQELPVRVSDAQRRGRDLTRGEGPERPAEPVFEGALHEQQDDDGDDPDQVVLAEEAAHLDAEQREGRHSLEAVEAAGRPSELGDEHVKIWPRPMVARAR